ncbi:MAG: DUF2431 domain-containing protein [Chlamydiia bacterium]|nr:DUF2431 domain-containing protein [Chlamydiia bacterium]
MLGSGKRYLFVGEGNFSFTEAFLNRFGNGFASSITATELKTKEQLNLETRERIDRLQKLGVKIILGFDATNAEQMKKLDLPVHSIYWNMPHNGKSYHTQSIPSMLIRFLKACRGVQNCGDEVRITIKQMNQRLQSSQRPSSYSAFSQGYEYDIVKATTVASYGLEKKKPFVLDENCQFPGYAFDVTNASAQRKAHNAQTFVFKKVEQIDGSGPSVYNEETIQRVHSRLVNKVDQVDCRRDGITYKRKFFNITTDEASTIEEKDEVPDSADEQDIVDTQSRLEPDLAGFLQVYDPTDEEKPYYQGMQDDSLHSKYYAPSRSNVKDKEPDSVEIFARDLDEFYHAEQSNFPKQRLVEETGLMEHDKQVAKKKRRYLETKDDGDLVELVEEMALRSAVEYVTRKDKLGSW